MQRPDVMLNDLINKASFIEEKSLFDRWIAKGRGLPMLLNLI
jgi:hypothetical protein